MVNVALESALVFPPRGGLRSMELIQSVNAFLMLSHQLSVATKTEVRVLMQHSLKEDKFAAMAECGRDTFAFYDKNPKVVFETVIRQILEFLERQNEQNEKAKPTAGKKRSSRPRGKSSKGERSNGLRKGRR